MSDPTPRTFRRDADGRPLWHAPLPGELAEDGRSYLSGPCQLCGEPWPCAEARYDAGPISITGISLVSRGDGRDLVVLAEIDGEWRAVIQTRYDPDGLLSYIVEPLGMRHSPADPSRPPADPSRREP